MIKLPVSTAQRRQFAGVVALALILNGCSPVNDVIAPNSRSDEQIEPSHVRARVERALDEAQEALGGTWDEQDNYLASGCDNSYSHYMYSNTRYRNEPAEDFVALTAALKQFWESEDLVVQEISYAPTHRILAVTMPWGDQLDYLVDDDKIMLSADTTCYLGNWAKINKGVEEAPDRRGTPSPAQ